jgi:hypothetical protein
MGVESNLLRGHGLGFYDVPDIVFRGDLCDDFAGFGGIRCAVDYYAALFRFSLESGVEFLQMLCRTVFDIRYPLYYFATFNLFEHGIAAGTVFDGELVEGSSEKGISEGIGDLLVVVAC